MYLCGVTMSVCVVYAHLYVCKYVFKCVYKYMGCIYRCIYQNVCGMCMHICICVYICVICVVCICLQCVHICISMYVLLRICAFLSLQVNLWVHFGAVFQLNFVDTLSAVPEAHQFSLLCVVKSRGSSVSFSSNAYYHSTSDRQLITVLCQKYPEKKIKCILETLK